ncbi:bifunctional UDP-N-acetylglucosamine diphosphorylase/glucosamine-1-phosphate N-acetyltransferase GlmU [Thermanaerosceptrum fracticalcis]|uniref:Bifunctional protein GlmU n=1 Tax=Thermanaerosceptrum fracticalcis TaxID=1712410 RepID=A0A7G6E5L2_THEFR|nr:bifunctional UDP-N-acetylglucosamine diphosphorylase/glucosamine-1-phosphate N-acetyltransferase GlmU [Thermanaerosceptrum fracticalcis]QNB47366.1 bifunctional UDP-N-acetylglucosamine diphosphorylase/glucosamine-1-phosphate N-acetyltransferase GlmU [Thermanaerosceptrum fracticalcis]
MPQSVAVVLAAGLGTRMKSNMPKVLHRVAGKPMIQHVINSLRFADVENIILVLGYQAERVESVLGAGFQIVYQKEQLGTGHAVLQALPLLQQYSSGDCLVVCGDTPLLRGQTLKRLREKHNEAGAKATILTALLSDPTGYGRIIKNAQGVEKIVEEKDAAEEEKAVREINTGAYCFSIESLKEKLALLTPANAQGEYYLTDVIKYLVEDGEKVDTLLLTDPNEAMGINNRRQLAEAEVQMRRRILEKLMDQGVTVINPDHTYVEEEVVIGKDTILYPGVILEGKTRIGENCEIGPNTRIVDSIIEDDVVINYSYLFQAKVAKSCTIGPYSYLRPGTVLAEGVKVGDFVEVKNSYIGPGSKVPHLSYVGDSTVGKGVNIGAGTITCNYDGVNKYPTYIGDGAFIGSNTNLVAPITVGEGAYIGAGSTVNKDIPAGALAVARGKQRNIENWKSRAQGTGKEEVREDKNHD